MLLKETHIEDYLKEHDLFEVSGKGRTVIGIIMPSTLDYIKFSSAAALATKYNVINLSDQGIVILAMDNATGKLVEGEHVFIPNTQISKVEVLAKLIHHRLTIETKAGNIKFKLNKIMIGSSWHKNNLPNVLEAVQQSFK